MLAKEVVTVVVAIKSSGASVWLDGGWGVDALLGQQTRDHDDLDLVINLDQLQMVIDAVGALGYELVENHLPTRAVLRTTDLRQIDLHPVHFDNDGTGRQSGAGPDGADCAYPANGFSSGLVGGESVRCLTAEVQIAHHSGYEPRDHDRTDMAKLAAKYGLALPEPY